MWEILSNLQIWRVAVECSCKVFIALSVTRLLRKCKMWSWTSPLPSCEGQCTCTKLPWYQIGVVGESWGLMVCLQPVTSIWIDLLLPKHCVLSGSLTERYWTRHSLPSLLQALYHLYFISCSLLLVLPICVLTPLNSVSHFLTFLLVNSLSDPPLINLEFKKGRLSPSCMNLEQLHILANTVKYPYPSLLIWKWNEAAWIRKITGTRNW